MNSVELKGTDSCLDVLAVISLFYFTHRLIVYGHSIHDHLNTI